VLADTIMNAFLVFIGNFRRRVPIIAVAMLGLALAGCTRPEGSSHDNFRGDYCGWFNLPARNERKEIIHGDNTLIPVFRRDGTYYSVWLGFEVPLNASPEGLEWALTPSSMTGTKIGRDAASKGYYLAVKDSQASNYSDGRYGVGEKELLTRTGRPPSLLRAKARPPRSNDDFLGVYQPVWFPQVRIEIRKAGGRYFSQTLEFGGPPPGMWRALVEPVEELPLPGQLGFYLKQDRGERLIYNEDLKRFELVVEREGMTPSVIRSPMARVPTHSQSGNYSVSAPTLKIGIPSWH
jgi:hypothetical protein